MTLRNGKVHRIEPAVPGVPRINHLEMQRACDRALERRGLQTRASWKRQQWLYGK